MISELWSGHGRNGGDVQCSKGNNSKRRLTRIMVYVFCTFFYAVIHWCEVS